VAAAAVLGACGGSGGEEVVDSIELTPTTTIDFADGALIRNEGVVLDPDGVPVTTLATTTTSIDPAAPTTVVTDTATTTTIGDNTTATTTAAGDTTATTIADNTTATTVADNTTATTDPADDDTTTSGSASASTPIDGSALEARQGLIVIDGVSFPFETSLCEVESDLVVIIGTGISSDGDSFETGIVVDQIDVDRDGTLDPVIEVSVDLDGVVDTGTDVAEFSASNVDTSGGAGNTAVNYRIDGTRISGDGRMIDFNGVAFPTNDPRPMRFEALCG